MYAFSYLKYIKVHAKIYWLVLKLQWEMKQDRYTKERVCKMEIEAGRLATSECWKSQKWNKILTWKRRCKLYGKNSVALIIWFEIWRRKKVGLCCGPAKMQLGSKGLEVACEPAFTNNNSIAQKEIVGRTGRCSWLGNNKENCIHCSVNADLKILSILFFCLVWDCFHWRS